MDHPELQDLVDAPRERLEVEYKAWLNLEDREVQAGLARHLCTLANHGGGFLVFGIADDMTPAGPQPPEADPYDQDRLSGIVRRYLIPTFQVAVYRVATPATGVTHPVVWVPSHDAVPMPHATFDPSLGEDEFLEFDLVSADGMRFGLADFWRISPDGMATLVRAYQEDRVPGWGSARGSDSRYHGGGLGLRPSGDRQIIDGTGSRHRSLAPANRRSDFYPSTCFMISSATKRSPLRRSRACTRRRYREEAASV